MKAKPNAHSITGVIKASKDQYETQENNRKQAANQQEKMIRWNQILKESRR